MRRWSDFAADARWRGLTLLCLLLALLRPAPAPAQAVPGTLTREPEIERGEARRLETTGTTQLNLNPVNLPPAAQRQRLSELREALSPTSQATAQFRIRALEGFLDYDQEDQMIYGPGRTHIDYDKYSLEADKVILDARLKEVQAEGNIVLKIGTDTVYADSLRYNFDTGEGVAYGAHGSHEPIYFQANKPKKGEEHIPQLQRVSKQESIFRNTNITTCDFKVPHYYVRGNEIVMYSNDKIFFRGATLYVMGYPVMYLPFYSRSLREGTPWFLDVGEGSHTGVRVRLGYRYRQVVQEPSLTDDNVYDTRQSDVADVFVDYLSKIGLGAGMDYKYSWNFGRDQGELKVYGLQQTGERNVVGADASTLPNGLQQVTNDDSAQRWAVGWKHRTALTDNVSLLFNVDEFSDPDIFYDVLDFFNNNADDTDQRDRVMTRSAKGELAYRNEAFVARLYGQLTDRITIDRFFDMSNPTDNDRQWDLNPFGDLGSEKLNGINADRWGRASEKMQADLMTRMLPVGLRPWYYTTDLHLYDNLDKGLNYLKTEDDSMVQGTEFYQNVLRQWKLSPRYTLITKAGFGMGAADRDSDSLGIPLGGPFPQQVDGLTFVDNSGTFLVGKRKMNLDQIQNAYLYGDAEAKLNARFTDSLTGQIDWRYRKTTSDYIGDWWAKTGNNTFTEDLFDYKLREHWVEANLNYALARPIMNIFLRVGRNLESEFSLFPNEEVAYAYTGYSWANQRQTLKNDGSVGWRERQLFDPTDPASVEQQKIFMNEGLSYSPIHQRWYVRALFSYSKALNGDVEKDSSSDETFFSDDEPDGDFKVTYGRELGPKYDTEISADWDEEIGGLEKVSWLLRRDLHDAVASVKVTLQNNGDTSTNRDQGGLNQSDVSFSIKLKLPNRDTSFGSSNVTTARDRAMQPAIAY